MLPQLARSKSAWGWVASPGACVMTVSDSSARLPGLGRAMYWVKRALARESAPASVVPLTARGPLAS